MIWHILNQLSIYKIQNKLSLYPPTKYMGGVEVQLHLFLTSGLDAGEWSASHLDHFTCTEKALGTEGTRRLGRPQSWSGCCDEEKIPYWELNPYSCHPAHILVITLIQLPWYCYILQQQQ